MGLSKRQYLLYFCFVITNVYCVTLNFLLMKNIFLIFSFLISFFAFSQQIPSFKLTKYNNAAVDGYFILTASDALIIMDNDANIVYLKPTKVISNFSLEKDDRIYYLTNEGMYFLNKSFHLLDSFVCKNGIRQDKHDAIVMPNGNILLLGFEKAVMSYSNAQELKKISKLDSALVPLAVLQEQDIQHNVVWEWHAKDHFDMGDIDLFYEPVNRPDLTHCNALELDSDGNILLSSRNMDEITKINKRDGSIMWRFGGKRNEFKFVNCPVTFYGQHNIRKLPNGHYTLFDNGLNTKSHGARALEFELDESNKTATLIWSYTYDKNYSTKGQGSVQRLDNGNSLVTLGTSLSSSGDTCFVIVNTKGEKIIQVNGPPAYRVMNFSSIPFELNRPSIKAFDSLGVKYLDAGVGYKSYRWSTGDSTRVIKLSKAGSYSVFVNYGDGGFISSENITVSNLLKPCDLKILSGRKKNRKQEGTKLN